MPVIVFPTLGPYLRNHVWQQSARNSQPFLHLLKTVPFFILDIVLDFLFSLMTDNRFPAKKKSLPSDEQFPLLLHDLSFSHKSLVPIGSCAHTDDLPCSLPHRDTVRGAPFSHSRTKGCTLQSSQDTRSSTAPLWMKSYCKALPSRLRGHPLTSA